MKIGIIGYGYVGKAIANSYKETDCKLYISDPKLGSASFSIEDVMKFSEAIFLALPTPSKENGECDESIVESVLKKLIGFNGVIISKSTLPPSTYRKLSLLYATLVHVPEFLTEKNSLRDYINSEQVIIGGVNEFCFEAEKVIKKSNIKANTYLHTSISTASLFKYIANTFLATKVTFMNDMYHLSTLLGVNWEDVKKLGILDERLGSSHWDVPGNDGLYGFAGNCFPKDISAIIAEGEKFSCAQNLLKSVVEINKKHRNLKTN